MRFDVAKGSQHLSHGRIHTFKNIGHKDTGNQRHNILNAWLRDDFFTTTFGLNMISCTL